MSRIGNKLITLAQGVTVEVQENNYVVVKGPKGEIAKQLCPKMEIKVEGAEIGMTHNIGGTGGTAAVHIFGRDL